MGESSASINSDSGEPAPKPRKNPRAILREEVKTHKAKLEDIYDQLDPLKFVNVEGSILVTNVIVQKFRVDINDIIKFFRDNKAKNDNYNFILDTQKLIDKLEDIMSKLNDALMAWNLSKSSGLNIKETLQAQGEYKDRLRECHNLIFDTFEFILVK